MKTSPIHGFLSAAEYERFKRILEDEVREGYLIEVTPDPDYHRGLIYGGQWFREVDTGEVWRLVAPDPPFRGLWEAVLHVDEER